MKPENGAMIRAIFVIGAIVLGVITLLAAGLGQAVSSITFTVNTLSDTDDGVCDGIHCSLREAINAANNAAGPDIIAFSLLPSSTITLAGSQLPPITDTLTIDGSTAVSLTISGNSLTRTFQIGSGTAVTITTLTIADGRAIFGGGVINDLGILNIDNTTFKNNYAFGDPSTWSGGGAIFNRGPLNINNSLFMNNSVIGLGGAVHLYCCFTSANISGSTFSENSAAGGGGGIAISSGGTVNISNSTFTDNSADSSRGGGGILNIFVPVLNITGSTFNGNSSSQDGGAITNRDLGAVNISNSTLSANSAVVYGGGIRNFGSGLLYVYNSTFSDNSASLGGGIFNIGLLNFANTIIANSTGGDCFTGVETIGFNINNLVEDGDCEPALTGDPLLSPLQDNGGPTWTHALTSPSPAVDNGDNTFCASPPVNNLDQRGVTRPLDGDGDGFPRCDIGAFEYDGPPPDRSYLPVYLKN